MKARHALWLSSGLPTSFLRRGCLIGSLEFAHSLSGAAFLDITWRLTSLVGCLQDEGNNMSIPAVSAVHWAFYLHTCSNRSHFQIPEVLHREFLQCSRRHSPHCSRFILVWLYYGLPLVRRQTEHALKWRDHAPHLILDSTRTKSLILVPHTCHWWLRTMTS